jgi:hypothetical protein
MAAPAQRLHLIPLVGEVVLVKLVVMLLVLLPGLVETVCNLQFPEQQHTMLVAVVAALILVMVVVQAV